MRQYKWTEWLCDAFPFHSISFLSFHLDVTWMNQSHIEMRLYACRFRADVWQSMILIFIAFFVLCANGYKPNYHSQSHLRAPSMPLQLDWCSLTVLLEIDKLAITLDPWLKVTRFRVAVSWKTKWNKTAYYSIKWYSFHSDAWKRFHGSNTTICRRDMFIYSVQKRIICI